MMTVKMNGICVIFSVAVVIKNLLKIDAEKHVVIATVSGENHQKFFDLNIGANPEFTATTIQWRAYFPEGSFPNIYEIDKG